jgi:hypothetical protein
MEEVPPFIIPFLVLLSNMGVLKTSHSIFFKMLLFLPFLLVDALLFAVPAFTSKIGTEPLELHSGLSSSSSN